MPALPRRRDPEARREAWLIHYGDVRIGSISLRAGAGGVDHLAWDCSAYPASHRGMRADGTAKSFDGARAEFEAAWRNLLPKLAEDAFDRYRRHEAFERWKHAMWVEGASCRCRSLTAARAASAAQASALPTPNRTSTRSI